MNIFISKKSQIGWALYDWASSPVPTLHATFIFSVYFTTVIMPEGGSVVWAYMTGITAILVAMVAPFLGSYADSSGKFKELIVSKIPSARLGEPEDIANAVIFLASNHSDYINGETLHVNGGMYMA